MIKRKALVFDLIGQLAHFKTFYSNASSLTYGFPPRTVIIGIIAAILGKERDSYYELLSPKNCKIAISVKEPIKKVIQTVNYIRTKKEDGFATFNSSVDFCLNRQLNTYPISIEIIMPVNDIIKYRIYFTSNQKIYDELKEALGSSGKQRIKYPLYLGLSEFLADIEWINEYDIENNVNKYDVVSVIPESLFDKIEFQNQTISLNIEKMPFHFSFDVDKGFRKITQVKKFIFESNGKPIILKQKSNICSINGENIIWMET